MLPEDKYFAGDSTKAWDRYCGFLNLSMEEFLGIQKHLLLEQIDLIAPTPIGKKLMSRGGAPVKPTSVEEFRRLVPLTTYEDYAPFIGSRQEDAVSQKAAYWAYTSGKGGAFKWVPFTERADGMVSRNMLAGLILSMAGKRGDVNLAPGLRILCNFPPRPYLAGFLLNSLAKRFTCSTIPPFETSEAMDFHERIEKGFKSALGDRVDLVASLSSVLVKTGESFAEGTRQMKFSPFMLHPVVLQRIASGWLPAKWEKRRMLPKDLWPVKGVVSWGIDTSINRERIKEYWGKDPYEFYAFTEAGFVALQAWNKKAMTFTPSSCFLEFIPEAEWQRWRENNQYRPATVLLNEVKADTLYEIVITSFYGMPFLRYRVGHLLKCVALKDEETGVNLPQMVFQSRADDSIDIAGFTRLDEKTMWQAIVNTKIRYADWTVEKQYEGASPVIRLYFEPGENVSADEVQSAVHQQLKACDADYSDLEAMLGIKPLRVTLLPKGAFQRYYDARRAAGADLDHMKPPHISAPAETIRELLEVGEVRG